MTAIAGTTFIYPLFFLGEYLLWETWLPNVARKFYSSNGGYGNIK
jgi:hypothetical protein